MKLRIWPWSKKVIERGREPKFPKCNPGHYVTFTSTDPNLYTRQFVIYEVTNHWTGSVTIEKEFID